MEHVPVQLSISKPTPREDELRPMVVDRHRFQVSVDALRAGLFVAELDRPWLDTPFLLPGFLIDTDAELQTLRRSCSFAYVDLDRSRPEAVAELHRAAEPTTLIADAQAEPADDSQYLPDPPAQAGTAGSARAHPPRADVRISAATRQRFRQFAREVAPPTHSTPTALGRILGWFARPLGGARREADPAIARHSRRGLLPADLTPVAYPEIRDFDSELPRARRAFGFCENALSTLLASIRVGAAVDLTEVTTGAYALVDSIIDNPDALMWVGRLRDTDFNAANHGVKVALYLVALGRHLGLPRRHLAELALIGMLADVGKVKVARSLLDKPGMLTPREFSKVKEHVRLGLEVIGGCDALPDGVELGIAQHHERLDGSGYPGGLKGDAISLYGRMAAIADSFAALITPRAYADASSPQDALMNLCEWAGSSFDEPLVEQFVQTVGAFPVGSLVELSTGEVAIVVTHGRDRPSGPKVLVLTWPDKSLLERPIERALPRAGHSQAGGLRILAGLPVGAYRIQPRDYYALGPVDRG